MEVKDKNLLKKAADILFEEVTDRERAIHLVHEENKSADDIDFYLLDGTKVSLLNIKRNLVVDTFGYTELSFKLILQGFSAYFESNIHMIVGFYIIIHELMSGGLMNVVTTGIIFFLIIVEEAGNSLIWWDVLNFIFFLQMCMKYILGGYKLTNVSGSPGAVKRSFFATLADICVFLFGNMNFIGDAYCQLSIIWVSILLKRQGYLVKDRYMLDNPSTASTRVRFTNNF